MKLAATGTALTPKRPQFSPLTQTIISAKRGEIPPQILIDQQEELVGKLGNEGFESLLDLAAIRSGANCSF